MQRFGLLYLVLVGCGMVACAVALAMGRLLGAATDSVWEVLPEDPSVRLYILPVALLLALVACVCNMVLVRAALTRLEDRVRPVWHLALATVPVLWAALVGAMSDQSQLATLVAPRMVLTIMIGMLVAAALMARRKSA